MRIAVGAPTDYVTALGSDPFSDDMLAAWTAEGIGTGLVIRVPGRLPGLYWKFSAWIASPARMPNNCTTCYRKTFGRPSF